MKKNPRILLVDDDPDDLSLLEMVLRQMSPDVLTVTVTDISGFTDCLLDEIALDAVVADPELEWADGLQVLEAIRRQHPHTPMFLLNGQLPAGSASRLAGLGHMGLLGKDSSGLLELSRLLKQCLSTPTPVEGGHDFAELVRLQEQLEQLTGAVSHDLRDPLQLITQHGLLLQRRYGEQLDDDARRFLQHIIGSTERMQAMIDGLLEYFRLGKTEPHYRQVDLNRVVKRALENLRGRIEESHARIEAPTLPVVVADERMMVHLFQNLLGNAIKFRGKADPIIQIGAEDRPEHWLISVTDNGIGIRPGDSERIFGMFQRLHTSDEYPGSGVGLAMCQRIAEQHGGDISVSSRPGEGTRFEVLLSKRLRAIGNSPDDARNPGRGVAA